MNNDDIDSRIVEQLSRILSPPKAIEVHTDLVNDADIDSLALMELIDRLEEEFSIEVPASAVSSANFGSVRAIRQTVIRLLEGGPHGRR